MVWWHAVFSIYLPPHKVQGWAKRGTFYFTAKSDEDVWVQGGVRLFSQYVWFQRNMYS